MRPCARSVGGALLPACMVVGLLAATGVWGQAYVSVTCWHDLLAVGQEIPLIGDFNGDGADDVVVFIRDTKPEPGRGDVGVALSDRLRFGPLNKWHEFFCVGSEAPLVGDFNGDRRDDIALFVRDTQGEPGAGDVYVALSSGSGFGPSSAWHTDFCRGGAIPAVGDVNGDGKDDIIAFYMSTRTGEAEGDVYLALAENGRFSPAHRAHEFFGVGAEVPVVGDFNGDRCEDIATCAIAASGAWNAGQVYVALSRGTNNFGFGDSSPWQARLSSANEVIAPGDLNGDGKCDLFTFNRANGEVKCAVSSGAAFADPRVVQTSFCSGEQVPRAGDFDGDGKADLAAFMRDTAPEPRRGDVRVARSRPIATVAGPTTPTSSARTWRFHLIRVIDLVKNETTNDEIYFIPIAFRSRFQTPNSTRVWWPSDALYHIHSLGRGEEAVISAEQALTTFPNVRILSDAEQRAGGHPELLGVCITCIERDDTPWGDVIGEVETCVNGMTDQLRRAVEQSSEAQLTADGFHSFLSRSVPLVNRMGHMHDDDDIVGSQCVAFVTTTPDCYQRLWPNLAHRRVWPTSQPHLFEPLQETRRNWDDPMVFQSIGQREGSCKTIWTMLPAP